MRTKAGLLTLLSLLSTLPALAKTDQSPIFATRFNGIAAPSTQYAAGSMHSLPAAILTEAPLAISDPVEGRRAMMATLTDWIGRIYDGALAHFTGDTPPATGSTPIRVAADPRTYQMAGVAADAQLRALGLDSKVGMRMGTEGMRQSLRLTRGCDQAWLPNAVSGDMTGGFGALTGNVQGSWGTACTAGQKGWRVTAGMVALGTADAGPSLGMEYRPRVGSLVTDLTGLTAMKAQVADTGGSVGFEAPFPIIRIDRMKLNADMSWSQEGGTALKLATRLRF
ncbi:MAG: hypothetical protein ACOVN0_11010 [Niveispirillum sp.]|uniref:hypothetical protein n=1 Tax=Niveispirillum sp. TaxID=1917217 RepID=UPI003BA7D82B